MSKLWGGRFTKQTNKLVEEYTASIEFDQALAEEDIQGSLAHVAMLGKCGIIPQEDADTIKGDCTPFWSVSAVGKLNFPFRMRIFT